MMSMMLTLAILFIFLKHPLSLGMILLIQTILISLSSGMLNINFWFSYILFLILIGGMMILFMYMTSIASNEKFNFSLYLFLMFWTCLYMNYMLIKFMKIQNFSGIELFNLHFSLNKYMNTNLTFSFIFLMFYLLITLIAVVKLTMSMSGPLRQMF